VRRLVLLSTLLAAPALADRGEALDLRVPVSLEPADGIAPSLRPTILPGIRRAGSLRRTLGDHLTRWAADPIGVSLGMLMVAADTGGMFWGQTILLFSTSFDFGAPSTKVSAPPITIRPTVDPVTAPAPTRAPRPYNAP
jgi:hypothetical protein